ncbi:2-polyprenylphenol 6-hydroxylase [Nitrospirillum amazonense]|uniref:2-polyprenylphenol 6-hydroxylase n=1 Tax=Nitrospirillum amazonense TaxID=28077 RepID=UPI0024125B9A|nr:2-polyprenylphenol 6-hydroxylase [Nitrospirillum amazonense]MDG3440562.1 2-polyprenylphenol 6-hydroxylase [Nitrospirillum amazonense]MEC4592907.1 2-polyprenylphenol 6-hydroxylase [Nitrospirillum amazonense]
MLRILRNLRRLYIIGRTLGRHGALFPEEFRDVAPGVALVLRLMNNNRAPGRKGQRLAAAIQELGPSFIKLGQALSTRSDLVGDAVAEDLALLRDRLPPFPTPQAVAIIEEQLGRPLGEIFQSFEPESVAAASIAQVHFAVTAEGKEVAVKVLRPGVELAFRRDIDLMFWLAGLAVRVLPRLKRLKPVEVVETFAETVRMEMDLRMEASAASELADNFKGDATFNIPRVDWDRTSQRVLTIDRIHGIPVDQVDAIRAAGFDPDDVLRQAANSFFNQVFRDGFFHADLHPGNMFVNMSGHLAPVDFGIMGRLDRQTRLYLADMLLGFLNRDYRLVADVHFDAGYVPAHQSRELFMQAARAIGEQVHNKPLHDISVGRLLAQLFAVTEQFEMETQPQLLLLQKSMLTAEGVGRALNPKLNMWEVARPLIEEWMRENRGPEARLAEAVRNLSATAHKLPLLLRHADRLAEHLDNGGVPIDPRSIDDLATRLKSGRGGWQWAAILALTIAVTVLALR